MIVKAFLSVKSAYFRTNFSSQSPKSIVDSYFEKIYKVYPDSGGGTDHCVSDAAIHAKECGDVRAVSVSTFNPWSAGYILRLVSRFQVTVFLIHHE